MNSVNTGGWLGILYRPHSSPALLWTRHKKLADVGLPSATWSSVLYFTGDPVAWSEPELPSALLRTSPCLPQCQPFMHDACSTARAIVGLLPNHWVSLNACFCTCLPMHACLSDGVQSNISEVMGEGIYNSPCASNRKRLPIVTKRNWCFPNRQVCLSQKAMSLSLSPRPQTPLR